MRFLDSVPISHFYLDLLYLHFYCYILFSLLLLLEVFPQCGVLSWKGAVAGEFNEYMGTRLLHSLQMWPSALTVSGWSSGQNLPSFSCYLQISPVCFLVSFSWLFCGSSVLSVIRHPTTTFCFFVHRCWYHSAPLALDCPSLLIPGVWGDTLSSSFFNNDHGCSPWFCYLVVLSIFVGIWKDSPMPLP